MANSEARKAEWILLTLVIRNGCLDQVRKMGVKPEHFDVPHHEFLFRRLMDYAENPDHAGSTPTTARVRRWFPWFSPGPVPNGETPLSAARAVVDGSLGRRVAHRGLLLTYSNLRVEHVQNLIRELQDAVAGHVFVEVPIPPLEVIAADADAATGRGAADPAAGTVSDVLVAAAGRPGVAAMPEPGRLRPEIMAAVARDYGSPVDEVLMDLAARRPWSWFVASYCRLGKKGRYTGGKAELAKLVGDRRLSVEQRSALLMDLWARRNTLTVLASSQGSGEGKQPMVEVTEAVLRRFLRAPTKADALGQWLGRNGVALDCHTIADEQPGILVRCIDRGRHPERAEGWEVWLKWLADSSPDAPRDP
jgi:hypothetical protein